jgi:hypothetical protein
LGTISAFAYRHRETKKNLQKPRKTWENQEKPVPITPHVDIRQGGNFGVRFKFHYNFAAVANIMTFRNPRKLTPLDSYRGETVATY